MRSTLAPKITNRNGTNQSQVTVLPFAEWLRSGQVQIPNTLHIIRNTTNSGFVKPFPNNYYVQFYPKITYSVGYFNGLPVVKYTDHLLNSL